MHWHTITTWETFASCQLFWKCSYRPCWTSTTLRRLSIPPHYCGSAYLLAGSDTYTRHCMQPRPLHQLSLTPGSHDSGTPIEVATEWATVWGGFFLTPLCAAGNQTHETACHPQANGLVENFHCQLKASIMTNQNPNHSLDLPLSSFLFFKQLSKKTVPVPQLNLSMALCFICQLSWQLPDTLQQHSPRLGPTLKDERRSLKAACQYRPPPEQPPNHSLQKI